MILSRPCLSWSKGLAVGIVLIWTSVIVIPYGAYIQTYSPNLREYEAYETARMSAAGLRGPGAGIGLALSSFWPFVIAVYAAIGLFFIFGILVVRFIARWNRMLALLASGIILTGCFLGAFAQVQEAIAHLRWGFIVRGAGDLLAAGGLIIGALGVLGYCHNQLSK